MPKFRYKAITSDGKKKSGKLEATDLDKATEVLKREGMIPMKVKKAGVLTKDLGGTKNKKVKVNEMAVFCRQIGSILDAGVPVVDALGLLAEQMENKTLSGAILDTKAEVEKGDTLAVSMRKHEVVFTPLLINLVEAGEATGNLERSFYRMAVQFEKSARLRASVKKSLIYPVMLICAAVIATIVMSTLVVPRFAKMFEGLGTDLPTLTKIVMGFSNFLLTRWYIAIAVVVVFVVGYTAYARSETGKHQLAALAIKLPIVGRFVVKNASASLSRTLGTLIGSGLPLAECIDITARSMGNLLFQEALDHARGEIQRGTPLWEPIKRCGLFPSMVCQMIKIGEESGNLEGMLEKAAVYFEDDTERAAANMTAMMEPLIILVMGGIIAVLVLAMYLPMINMYGSM